MSADELLRAHLAYERSASDTEALRRARNDIMREAVSSGEITQAEAARLTGLTTARVNQIVKAG